MTGPGPDGAGVPARTALQTFKALLGTWALPPDWPARIALGFAVTALVIVVLGRGGSLLGLGKTPLKTRLFLFITAFVSALLSVFWIAQYLHGGPRIIDATAYFMQGRALSHMDLSWPVLEPTASGRGRFLDFREVAGTNGGVAGGIFPPGFPLLLAFGFGLGAPMIVGPLLAAALVVMTYRFTRTLAERSGIDASLASPVARGAALLSVVCGALRYHTADTMAHGATALGIVIALDSALRGRALVAGLALGGVVATRPVSAIGVGLVVVWILARTAEGRMNVLRLALGAIPGVFLLLASQKAVTGSWWSSTQRMYYAMSDGPPECFRYGFGSGIGCVHEHGDFVAARLKSGHGLVSAAGATLRRLHMHLTDVANFEPLALLVLVPLARSARGARSRAAAGATLTVILLHVLLHAPFYFDGNYPGGGARFFADLLPLEHALLALAIAQLAGAAHVVRGVFAVLGLSLAGFALHAVFGHVQLAERDGGRPMYEPDVVQRSGVNSGIAFVDTDHGFLLGHDPYADPKQRVKVLRLCNDDRDRMQWLAAGEPASYHYRYQWPPPGPLPPGAPTPPANPQIVQFTPPPFTSTMRFEAECEWPAIAQAGGHAESVYSLPCTSMSKALTLTPDAPSTEASADITVPVQEAGRYSIVPRVVNGVRAEGSLTLMDAPATEAGGPPAWSWKSEARKECTELPAQQFDLKPPTAHFRFRAKNGAATLDKVTLTRMPSSP